MGLREDLLPCLDDIQALAGPGCLDLRTTAVFIVTRQYNEEVDLGTSADREVEITPRPHVKERARGREVICKPVHHQWTDGARTGGLSVTGINPADRVNTEVFFRLKSTVDSSGNRAGLDGEFDLIDYNAARPFRQVLILKRRPGIDDRRLAHPQPQGVG